ncbi:protein ALP1-like, partial [Telopea speciosissima]|uniref:protein ALP1-like n=1 Tax=Telopea speciosissima TaxID=54955 RepID=UPI001CC4BF35
FGLDSASACRAFDTVCKAVNNQLLYLFDFPSDLGRIIECFGWISLPNCCGVLGFSRFPVDGGALGKKDGAIIAQGLVDGEGRILDVSAGWPSYMSPDTIHCKAKLFQRVEESKELLNGPALELGDGKSVPQYILRDSCFPLLPWLLTFFPESNIDDEHSSSQ